MKIRNILPLLTITSALSVPSISMSSEETSQESNAWTGEAELGYQLKEGNTESEQISAKIDSQYQREIWRYNLIAEAGSESTSRITTEEEYLLSGQANRKIGHHGYLLARLSYEKDRFSGFDYQTSANFGYGNQIFKTDIHTLELELAPGVRVSKLEDSGDREEDATIRGALDYKRKLSDTATFTQLLSVEAGEDNTESKSETALKTAINSALALKIAFIIDYTEEVPLGKKHADRESVVSIVYGF